MPNAISSYRLDLKNEKEIACIGHASEQSLHFVQRESVCGVNGSCKSISSWHASLQTLQSAPLLAFKQLLVSMAGLKKRFIRLIREMSAPRGQNFRQVKRKKINSSAKTAGKTISDHVGSLN